MFTLAARAAVAIALTLTATLSATSSDIPTTENPPTPQVLSSTSAPTIKPLTENELRTITLENYLAKHNAPLAPNAADFIDAANTHGIEWHLLPAIAGVESTFGKHVPQNSYNPFGWANGAKAFTSWKEGIYTVAEGLERMYYAKGRNTPELIQPIYCPPSTTWQHKVRFFMNKIGSEHSKTLADQGLANDVK